MSFNLKAAIIKFAKDFLQTEISEDANEVDTMATIQDAAATFTNEQNQKIAKVADMQNEFAALQTSVSDLVSANQQLAVDLNAKIDKLVKDSEKKASDLRAELREELAKESTSTDEEVKTKLKDTPPATNQADIKAFGKNEPLKIKIG